MRRVGCCFLPQPPATGSPLSVLILQAGSLVATSGKVQAAALLSSSPIRGRRSTSSVPGLAVVLSSAFGRVRACTSSGFGTTAFLSRPCWTHTLTGSKVDTKLFKFLLTGVGVKQCGAVCRSFWGAEAPWPCPSLLVLGCGCCWLCPQCSGWPSTRIPVELWVPPLLPTRGQS